ncbi:MAG: Crp/Fnr family transcriptional regulator [Candidatus Niameybacter stercoravium]|nr:Crp/Fnr family transcriptional regulator [Candidatus Niameybacter stercoravium]
MNVQTYIQSHPQLAELFSEIPNEELKFIQINRYAPNQLLIQRGSQDTNLFIILYGICDVLNELETGINICNYRIAPFDVIGFTEIITDTAPRIASVISRTPVTAAVIPREAIQKWFGTYPAFTKKLTFSIVDRLHKSIITMAECKSYSLRTNLISYLMHTYELYRKTYPDTYSGAVKINESRQMMSEFLGVDVRSINRIIESLKSEELLAVIRGKIHIHPVQYNALIAAKYEATR